MGSIQSDGGAILADGGAIAAHSDCCCGDPETVEDCDALSGSTCPHMTGPTSVDVDLSGLGSCSGICDEAAPPSSVTATNSGPDCANEWIWSNADWQVEVKIVTGGSGDYWQLKVICTSADPSGSETIWLGCQDATGPTGTYYCDDSDGDGDCDWGGCTTRPDGIVVT